MKGLFVGLPGGPAFWENYAERVICNMTDNHARLKQLQTIVGDYDTMNNNDTLSEAPECYGCRHYSDQSQICHVCNEFFCGRFPGTKCMLLNCSRCKKACCLSDRTFENGSLICIDCIDIESDESNSMSLYSDSEPQSPSESEEEEEGSE
jgi:hypothetical protein